MLHYWLLTVILTWVRRAGEFLLGELYPLPWYVICLATRADWSASPITNRLSKSLSLMLMPDSDWGNPSSRHRQDRTRKLSGVSSTAVQRQHTGHKANEVTCPGSLDWQESPCQSEILEQGVAFKTMSRWRTIGPTCSLRRLVTLWVQLPSSFPCLFQ